MEAGDRVWVLKNIRLRDGLNSTGPAWIHIPSGSAYVVKSLEFGRSIADKIHYVHYALPEIVGEDWDYAE